MVKVMTKYVIYFLGLLTLAFSSQLVSATNISVTTDRQDVGLNESFVMIFESDGSVDDDPDFSPLQEDFQILSRSSSSNMSIVNGKISSTKTWKLTALARRAGKLIIPTIKFGSDQSQASFVNVSTGRGSISKKGTGDDIFIEVEVNDTSPYIQAEVIYTVRLFLSVAVSNASLTEIPQTSADAIVERIDEDKRFQTRRAGKRYEVIERRYAIYPLASGRVSIEPVTFQGQTSRSAFSIFDPFGPEPKTIVERSEPVTLDVRPVPDSFPGQNWLPAKNLQLNESWSKQPPAFQAGEPITRTITLSAKAQVASQLPVLDDWQVPGFKLYPDQPQMNDERKADGTLATRQEKTAIIPEQAGKYTLPEMRIPWWNTEQDKLEYAELPTREVMVQPAAGAVLNPDILPAVPQLESPQIDGMDLKDPGIIMTTPDSSTDFWKGLSAGLALAWLITLFIWWKQSRSPGVKQQENEQLLRSRKVIAKLKSACSANDSEITKQALLDWAKIRWEENSPASLGAIAKNCSPELANAIAKLNDSLYSQNTDAWQGAELWQCFEEELNAMQDVVEKKAGKLQPLYKI